MLGDRVPGVVGEALRELQLRLRVEPLPRQAQRGDRDAGREPLRPVDPVVLDRHQVGVGLQLQADVELDVARRERRDHGVPQVVVGRTEGKPRDARALLGLRPDRVLHRLALAEQVRHAAEVGRLERARLRLDPEPLHHEVEHVRLPEVQEVEDLRVLEAPELQVRVRLDVLRHEGWRRHAEHVERVLLLVHQLRTRHPEQLDADAHEADVRKKITV